MLASLISLRCEREKIHWGVSAEQRKITLYMGRRPDRLLGGLVCCRLAVVVIFVCVGLLVVMVAMTSGVGVSLGPDAAADLAGGGVTSRTTTTTTSSPARYPAGGDALRSSKRRIPKGPDPIHNRRAGKMTIAPRRRG